MTTTIYIVTHKDFVAPNLEGYVPLLAGAALNCADISLKDNDGKNISNKNLQYCELTAQYWVWNNIATSDNIGFVHYRRFFYTNKYKKQIVPVEQFEHDLEHYDAILPTPWILSRTVRNQFAQFHNIEDLMITRRILAEKFPDFLEAFDEVLAGHRLYSYNMFVMTRQNFNGYMTWLFDVLGELERYVDVDKYDSYNRRLFGFLSERLLSVWVQAKKWKVKCYPVYKSDENWTKIVLKNSIKRILFK